MGRNIPTGDFVTTTLNGALAAGAAEGTIGTGLNLAATNGVLQVDYDSANAVGVANGPETFYYTSYNTSTGAITGLTRGRVGTTDVDHANGASVQAGPSIAYLEEIQALIEDTEWTAWTPTFTASGSMTYTPVTTNKAVYRQVGKLVFFRIDASGTTGGVASNTLFFTLPVTAKDTFGVVGTGLVVDVSAAGAFAYFESTTQAGVQKYNVANFSLAAGIAHRISGVYEAA